MSVVCVCVLWECGLTCGVNACNSAYGTHVGRVLQMCGVGYAKSSA